MQSTGSRRCNYPRMFETANICIFEGESYRMKGRILLKDFDKEN